MHTLKVQVENPASGQFTAPVTQVLNVNAIRLVTIEDNVGSVTSGGYTVPDMVYSSYVGSSSTIMGVGNAEGITSASQIQAWAGPGPISSKPYTCLLYTSRCV